MHGADDQLVVRVFRPDAAAVEVCEVGDDRSWRAERLNAEQKTVLFRVMQESLTNAAKHAQASRIDVTLRTVNDVIRMRIKDNGHGFAVDQQRSAKGEKRLGLLGMQERVRLVNGSFVVKSSLGRGTTVEVEIPFKSGSQSEVLTNIPSG